MHILILPSEEYVPLDNPLAGIFQRDQALALQHAGHQVGILSTQIRSLAALKNPVKAHEGMVMDLDEGIPVLRWQGVYWIPKAARYKLHSWLRGGLKLAAEYIRNYGIPDVIHAHNIPNAGILAERIQSQWGIPYIITEHSSTYARGMVSPAILESIRNAAKGASFKAAVSPALAALLEKTLGHCGNPWRSIPNLLPAIYEEKPPARTRMDQAVPFCFLNVGTLIELKGQRELLESYALSFRGRTDTCLRIVGDGPLLEQLQLQAQRLGIESAVTFTGGLDRHGLRDEYLACDVYVHPSHYETFGLTIVEAMACGKPVIATRCGGPDEVVRPEDGLLVEPKNVPALANALLTMRNASATFDSKAIRRRAIQLYGAKTYVKMLEDIYRQVLEQKG